MIARERLEVDFRKLWGALSVSLIGSEVTALALPLIAVISLGVSPLEIGVLAASRQLPFFLFSLPAGVWVDKMPRRPVLIAADLGSRLLLVSLPLAVLFGGPWFIQLCVVAFGLGSLAVLSDVAHYAYVPYLVGRRSLTAYNSRLQISHSASGAAGPGVAGILIQFLSAPVAVLADAASFLLSALLLATIRKAEPPAARVQSQVSMRQSVVEGMAGLFGNPLLRVIILGSSIVGLFEAAFIALYVLFAARELELSPGMIGLIFAAGGLGAIPGAILADRLGKLWGMGPAIIVGYTLNAVAAFVVPAVAGPSALILAVLALANGLGQLTYAVANVHQWSFRQAVTPDHMAGRVTASHRFLVYGAGAIGAILGGGAGAALGLRPAMFACATGMLLGALLMLASPLRHSRGTVAETR